MIRTTLLAAAASLALPAAASAYELPLRANDLTPGERYHTFIHTGGSQAEGQDIGARRHKSGTSWSGLKADGADKKNLDNWIIYGKPFYAMADGVVTRCWRNAPNNPVGGYHPDYDKGLISGGGNALWIKHDDGSTVLYAHAQPGSIPSEICPNNNVLFKAKGGKGETDVANGARVKVGQRLGRIGNSGSSGSGPHLHVHMNKDGKPHVMPFARGMTTPFEGADLNGPWTRLKGKALPKATILVWPPHGVGNYKWNGTRDEDYQRLVDHMQDSGMMPSLITCADSGQSYNSQWVPEQGQWRSHHGMTDKVAAEKHALYTGQGFKRTSSYTCGSRQVAVWRK